MRWYSMPVGFLQEPEIEKLGEIHGAPGPLVMVSLYSGAALAEEHGRVSRSFRLLATDAFTDRETAVAVISSATEEGLCHDVSQDGHAVSLTLTDWDRKQNAGRKAKSRAKQKAEVTDGHSDVTEESRHVLYRQTDRQIDRQDARAREDFSIYDSKTIVDDGSGR
jgi:hypothetical protein